MYPSWYETEMDQLEYDLSNCTISNEEYNKGVYELDRQLYEHDAEPLGSTNGYY
jgi:hypothetical protein